MVRSPASPSRPLRPEDLSAQYALLSRQGQQLLSDLLRWCVDRDAGVPETPAGRPTPPILWRVD
jgi:hypothetical protein